MRHKYIIAVVVGFLYGFFSRFISEYLRKSNESKRKLNKGRLMGITATGNHSSAQFKCFHLSSQTLFLPFLFRLNDESQKKCFTTKHTHSDDRCQTFVKVPLYLHL